MEDFQAKINRLERELEQRDQFLSIASHELKTPLTAIYGVLQLQERMLRPKPNTAFIPDLEKLYSFLKIVIKQVERLNDLIDHLLDISRIQNGRFTIEPLDTEMVGRIRDAVLSRLTVIARDVGVKIELNLPEQLIAHVDPIRLDELITNLTMNAIRFSPEGGTIWIKLRTENHFAVLSFRDQGPPISIPDRERIFHPFEQAQRTSRLGGLGLGLFISRQIAQMHKGDVSLVESTPGKGNLFVAKFPL